MACCLTALPDELLLLLSRYLSGTDLSRLSRSCRRLLRVLGGDDGLWDAVFRREGLAREATVDARAIREAEDMGEEVRKKLEVIFVYLS